MVYVIDSFLKYDTLNGILSTNDSDITDVRLSITANALLLFLFENKDSVISRDEIMTKVWDDNGMTSSNSNLNQYLSILRKAFRKLGIENVIMTLPKSRLEINKELSIQLIQPSVVTNDDLSTTNNPQNHDGWIVSTVILFVVAMILLWSSTLSTFAPDFIRLTKIKTGNCEIYSPESIINKETRRDFINNFDLVKKRQALSCSAERVFLFSHKEKLNLKDLGRTFVAQCAKNASNSYAYCDSYFYYSWNNNETSQ
ncbi:winged helix-turn-helix domain-containing protein [Photobacterium leiognathi]|uniref:winged helix-turn-helix domain-containing protein n=1 Tax=Photobacterium leiognathi TaxID=553611 RepID=UPI001EDFAEBD|nr:winged helix-turn-helix domain-containing protein [Photobacterium leiognathi]